MKIISYNTTECFDGVDNLASEIVPGELVLIGCHPSIEVRNVLVDLSINLCRTGHLFYFAPIKAEYDIVGRIVCSILGNTSLVSNLSGNDFGTVEERLKLSGAFNRIHFHDSCADSLEALKRLRDGLIEKHHLKFIVVESLTSLCDSKVHGEFINALKGIAKDFGVTVIVGSEIDQFHIDRRPTLKDFPKDNMTYEVLDRVVYFY